MSQRREKLHRQHYPRYKDAIKVWERAQPSRWHLITYIKWRASKPQKNQFYA